MDQPTIGHFWIHKHMLGMENGCYVGKLPSTSVSTFEPPMLVNTGGAFDFG